MNLATLLQLFLLSIRGMDSRYPRLRRLIWREKP